MFEDSRRVDPDQEFPALAAAIEEIPARLDRAVTGVASGAVLAQARALIALRRRLDARLLSLLAVIDAQGLADGDGFSSAAGWVRGYANLDAHQAGALVAAARVAQVLPHLGGVLAAGTIGVEHLAAVAAGARSVPAELLAEHDQTLRNLAPHVRPRQMRQAGQAIQAGYDQDAAADDAGHVRAQRRLSLSKTFAEAYHLEGLLEPEAGATLSAVLDSLSARTGPDDDRTPTQRRADALVELATRALAEGTLPDLGGDRPRVTFVITTPPATTPPAATGAHTSTDPAEADPGDPGAAPATAPSQPGQPAPGQRALGRPGPLGEPVAGPLDPVFTRLLHRLRPAPTGSAPAGGLHVAAYGGGRGRELIGDGSAVTDATLARVCCDADLAIAVVNEWGEPLNLSRTSRTPNQAQRRALVLRDHHCVFPGCDTPAARCQVHHLDFWSHLGPTDLTNLALVCWYHHHAIHEDRWHLQPLPATPATPTTTAQPPGWLATAPDGHQLRQHRRPAA